MTVSSTTAADPLLTLSQRKGMNWRTFVVPEARVLFVQLNKNACTSLKWMIAHIAGEDLAAFGPGTEASTNRYDDIHDRRQWHEVPKLGELDAALRTQIRPDNGWFIFSVTRDPRSRLFSAWQSKLLLRNPGYRSFGEAPWFPRHPVSTESVLEDFERFVAMFEDRPTIGLRRDGHFRDQVEMLHEDLVDYSEIYDIRDMGRLQSDLRTHLAGLGLNDELYLPRVNDTPLRANAAVFADGVRERVEALYAADFARFGDRWDYSVIEAVPDWTKTQLAEIDLTAEHGHRVGLLLDEAGVLRSEVADQRARARAERARADELARRVQAAQRPLPWRAHLRADARRAVAGVRRRLRSG